MLVRSKTHRAIRTAAMLLLACCYAVPSSSGVRVIDIIADHNSRYRIPGQSKAGITALPGEELVLRITAIKAADQNRDGSIHGFTLLNVKDHKKVSGWDFLLKPGTQEIIAHAPLQPGEYEVVCTVICSHQHEGMHMKFVVLPSDTTSSGVIATDEKTNPDNIGPTQTFQGEIADTQCAFNVHSVTRSHEEMIKAKKMGSDAASCARYCVRNMGGSFVLLGNKEIVYRLDNQDKAEKLSGKKVRITGTLDRNSNTIRVVAISTVE